MKTLILTGGSSGIGKATCELFASNGWYVYELSRHGQSNGNITHIDCDVTNEESIKNAFNEIFTQTQSIDVLINNAGFGISGAIEFTALEDAKKQFDVNFFGALNVVKAILPHFREQKSGRIIFTSSVAAVLSVPYQSFYSASKAAINAMALALQNEVREFGIKVSILMPGDVSTAFTSNRNKSEEGENVYSHIRKAVSTMEKDEQNGMTPQKIAKQLWKIANKSCPGPIYVAGGMYKVFYYLDCILPKRLVNWLEGVMY